MAKGTSAGLPAEVIHAGAVPHKIEFPIAVKCVVVLNHLGQNVLYTLTNVLAFFVRHFVGRNDEIRVGVAVADRSIDVGFRAVGIEFSGHCIFSFHLHLLEVKTAKSVDLAARKNRRKHLTFSSSRKPGISHKYPFTGAPRLEMEPRKWPDWPQISGALH